MHILFIRNAIRYESNMKETSTPVHFNYKAIYNWIFGIPYMTTQYSWRTATFLRWSWRFPWHTYFFIILFQRSSTRDIVTVWMLLYIVLVMWLVTPIGTRGHTVHSKARVPFKKVEEKWSVPCIHDPSTHTIIKRLW